MSNNETERIIRAPQSRPDPNSQPPIRKETVHLFIYGLEGSGKSSIRKLLEEGDTEQVTRCKYYELTATTQLRNFTNSYRHTPADKHVVLMVIRMGRITNDMATISRKEIEYLRNPENPVLVCVTGCDTNADLDRWVENFKEFSKYGLTFQPDRVLCGCSLNVDRLMVKTALRNSLVTMETLRYMM